MTPTLLGRWQSRVFLLGTIGSIVTIFFARLQASLLPYFILVAVIIIGLVWDILYEVIQKGRWDHDWPPILQLTAGLAEGVLIFFVLIVFGVLTNLQSLVIFWLHYASVWLATFLASQSIMRIIFPRWRFKGGQWL